MEVRGGATGRRRFTGDGAIGEGEERGTGWWRDGLEAATVAWGRQRREGDQQRCAAVTATVARWPAAATTAMSSWPKQGVAAVGAATAGELLPQLSVSSHSRWRRLLSFVQ